MINEKIKLRLAELGFTDEVTLVDIVTAEQFLLTINQSNVESVSCTNGQFVITYNHD